MDKSPVALWQDLADRKPAYALVGNVDFVIIRYDGYCFRVLRSLSPSGSFAR